MELLSKCKGSIKRNILLSAIWITVIVTGFLALFAIVGGMESLVIFSRIHSLAVRLGLVYTTIHTIRNREQMMSCLGVKIGRNKQVGNQHLKNNCAIKVTIAIVLHILLHIVSIHLAVAYTLFHAIQHRYGIASLFKKLLVRNNIPHNCSVQSIQLIQVMQPIPLAA